MAKEPIKDVRSENNSNPNEFRFATKEGLIIVSLILFGIYALWYYYFEAYYSENRLSWLFIFAAYSLVVFITMLILFITGFFVFWKDRKYIIIHERLGGLIFIIGALMFFLVPLGWAYRFIDFEGVFASNTIPFIGIGIIFCVLGSILLARNGGFFTVWMIGILIYLLIPFNVLFGIFPSEYYGHIDNFLGSIGIYIVITSFILFLYHDLKFFYLSKIVKQGNKFRKEKQYEKAIKCFNKTLKIYPFFTTAWNNIGNVYFNQGNIEKAKRSYKRALRINPNYINAKRNLEVVSKRTGKV
jgi:tetratricopeptide (TPR) repeat protein